MARIAALLIVALLAWTPAVASAAGHGATAPAPTQQEEPGPAEQLLQGAGSEPQQAPAQSSTQTTAESGSLSTADMLLIAVGIAALIGGIWFVIARDAKRVTGGRVRAADSALGEGRGGSATRAARRSRRLSADERKRRRRGRAR